LFHQGRVSDFLIEKDPLFARITLDDDEYRLYQTLYDKVIEELPQPDLVVCLQAPTNTLFDRVQLRGNSIERGIDLTYLQTLNDA
jgi:deoxyadenosine/deoxycytidine kinase